MCHSLLIERRQFVDIVSKLHSVQFIDDAAGELMIPAQVLRDDFALFPPQLEALAFGGSVSRADFKAWFREAQCIALAFQQNQSADCF